MKHKILFILPYLSNSSLGGAENITLKILNKLQDSIVFSTELLTLSINKSDKNILNKIPKKTLFHNLKVKRSRHAFFRLFLFLLKNRSEYIFCSSRNIAIVLLLLNYFLKRKIIIRCASMLSLEIKEKYISSIMLKLVKKLYPNAHKIISQTDEMKKDLLKHIPISNKGIQTLPNILDIETLKSKVKNTSSPYQKSKRNIVAVGRIGYEKGYDILLKAFHIAYQTNPSLHLHIVGRKEPIYKELLNLTKTLNIVNNVTFHGFQENPYPFIKFADIFVLSSRWEGFPNVVLEAMYFNKPIVSTDCLITLFEYIFDGKNGYIVPTNNYTKLAEGLLKALKLKQNIANAHLIKKHHEDYESSFIKALN